MNRYSMGLTVISRLCDFLPAARNEKRLDHFAKVIAIENVDEMLVALPGARAMNLSNTADPLVLSQKVLSPFGDW